MFSKLFSHFSYNLGLDLGTANTQLYEQKKGLVINWPTVIAVNTRNDQILSVGKRAEAMSGKTPPYIQVIKPIDHGVISDFEITEKLIKLSINKIQQKTFNFSPRPVIFASLPLGVTEVEKKSVEDVAIQSGARTVYLIEQPMAAAIGARLSIKEPVGNFIVEMGAGLTQIAVISLEGIVTSKSLPIAGQSFNNNIILHIREKFNLLLGNQVAEEIKIKIGNALLIDQQETQKMKIKGQDLLTGLPKEISIIDKQINEAMQPTLKIITEAIKDSIELVPASLTADIYERGIVLSGGSSLLKNLDKLISQQCGVPVHLIDDPATAVIRGLGYIIEDFDNLKNVIVPSARD